MKPPRPGRGPARSAGRAARTAVLGLVAALVAPALGSLPAQAGTAPVPGSPGIGDPYFPLDGNGGIDVRRYEVHDSYRFARGRLSGRTVVTLEATEDLSRFQLDFLLPVRGVRVDGRPVGWSRPDRHELRIDAPLTRGSTYDVVVRYAGRPGKRSWDGERSWLADDTEVVAMNEPHMATWWFPANDHPRDKALMDISITVSRDRDVIANGRRVSRTVHGRRATTRWRAAEPMAPYLAFFAAGHFVVRKGRSHGLPWLVAVSKEVPKPTRARSLRLMRRTPAIVHWLQGELGRYPFSSTGGLTTGLSPGFALENQTRPTYPVLSSGSVGTVVHELAHQWFGDSVAVRSWRDIWLNEGAATFMEARYAEAHGGERAQQWMEDWYDSLGGQPSFWSLDVADPGPAHLFDWPVYQRGGMALQALRHRIGNDDFWRLLRTWLRTKARGNGSTEEFTALAERVSGEDLDGFFDAWLRDPGRPARTAANGF
ncbi:M1 family metallopeptidase [Nocardioides sp. MAHUQ-72]|uniref:M1 family metallopeptidase n=1 Tax=unclassified Nocardioides TaxID=2615069 RepID=UPI00361A8269